MKVTVAIADDMPLLLRSLSVLVNTFDNFVAIIEAINGEDLLKKLDKTADLPDILLLDVNMPVMDGFKTAQAVTLKYPLIKIIALSTNDDDLTVINMIKAGCCSYLFKDMKLPEFEKALLAVHTTGYYNADAVGPNLRRLFKQTDNTDPDVLNEREINFLQLACSDLTYKQIASIMNVSERTVDGYRESVFAKLAVQSRVGMALAGIHRKIISFPLH